MRALKKSKKIILSLIAVVLVICCIAAVKSLDNNKTNSTENTDPTVQAETTSVDIANEYLTLEPSNSADVNADNNKTTAETANIEGIPASKEEIIALYNEAANKVKLQTKRLHETSKKPDTIPQNQFSPLLSSQWQIPWLKSMSKMMLSLLII